MTIQRRTVLEVLDGRLDHPTVDVLFDEISERLPGTSKATVYRALETLCEFGLAQRVAHPGSAVRFDPNVEPHHHFLCEACGAMSDVPGDELSGELPTWVAGPGTIVREASVTFRGTSCPRCPTPS